MSDSKDQGSVLKFSHVPYNERWEPLKPAIVKIYIEENNRISQLAQRMKDEYDFDAQIHQYRYHFKKWNIKKRITTQEKETITKALGKRSRKGISTSDVLIDQGGFEKAVDRKNLKRYIYQSIRKSCSIVLRPPLFLRHDLPYAALERSLDDGSPTPTGPATPSYVTIHSPKEEESSSDPPHTMSPTQQLVQRKILSDWARLILEDGVEALMAQLGKDDRMLVVTWFHDFWIYAFITAKYWGKGPVSWCLPSIHAKTFAEGLIPSTSVHCSDRGPSSEPLAQKTNSPFIHDNPTQLCNWSIHDEEPDRGRVPSPSVRASKYKEQFDIYDESTWNEWPIDGPPRSFTTVITQGLQQNIFTTLQSESLPFATDSIIQSVDNSLEGFQAEALGFAIMARNLNVIDDILQQLNDAPDETMKMSENISAIFPFHLAATFLDGAKACCRIMDRLVNKLEHSGSIGVNYVNNLGHTVIDALLVTILRSHSNISPEIVSDSFNGRSCFPGQDVDPCGRWDADSPCTRKLHASGRPTIPRNWKHMFCHTAIQAICHCISTIFLGPSIPNINTTSGLFTKRCYHCGLQLKVGPLHALVLTAFYLANEGMPGENLFGMIACLVCLLTFRADPRTTMDISIPALLGQDSPDVCQHAPINAAELSIGLMQESWSPEIKLGWKTLTAILQYDIAHRQDQIPASNSENEESGQIYMPNADSNDCLLSEGKYIAYCRHYIHRFEKRRKHEVVYCGNQLLGRIWAVIQAELLTYRRLSEDDLWLSPEFSLSCVLRGLEENDDKYILQLHVVSNGGVAEKRLKAHSHCGLFDADHPGCARREEACASYYGNLDDWKRTTFIGANHWDG
ncbi:hypothetical protein GGS26DRAFT_581378 [Hypomontagnella submonticulosa]|nr:hypothetical protein GGS26DRAFT_581378 [Hypomontagnella submonticulosa]